MSKLLALQFDANNINMEYFYELDMLTTAFVVTYARLQQGKGGAGFDRKQLPEELREMHDEIIRLRNKRFGHDDVDLGFIEPSLEISVANDRFVIHPQLSVRYQIGGDPRWSKLVTAIQELYYNRHAKLIESLSRKTGKEWKYASQDVSANVAAYVSTKE